MAARKKTYEQKAQTSKIVATSRMSVKIRDNYYTIETQEERTIQPMVNGELDMDKEWQMLWHSVNSITDGQIRDILDTFKK